MQPTGTVTFLFTDIEGSTKRWEQFPAEMAAAVARHDELLRGAIEANHGHVFKTIGDAFCAAFANPLDSVAATIAAQHALAAEDWGAVAPIRARMALHTGAAEERANDYFGPSVNRVARLLSAGYGEQVLISRVTAEQICSALPEGAALIDLGEHRLKDLLQAEHIFQLAVPGLTVEFPPIKTLDRQRHNLPAQPTSLVGREAEVTAAREMLDSGARLLTLTGPGGIGKTRLGLQIAAEMVESFADGVWFVPLAPLTDSDLVIAQIAAATGVREAGDAPLLEQLKQELATKELLLVLDNFEHVAAAAPALGTLLAACPKVKIIVTSRTVLRIYGERELVVAPLGLPNLRRLAPVAELEELGAIRLFVDRAQAAKPDFGLTEANARAVAEICVRLDGLPLAIELAAARTKLLAPANLLTRLESRLKLLTGGGVDRDQRQQTLRGAIAWSYDLLDASEQLLFRRLAVFSGGCTFEVAELITNGDGNLDIDLFDGIASLIDKSLLRQEETDDGEPRFVMLETLREFGLEQLEAAGEADSLRARHAAYFTDLAIETTPALEGTNPVLAIRLLEREHDNLRTAVSWSHQTNPAQAMALTGALWLFWDIGSHITEGREQLMKSLALAAANQITPADRVPVLRGAIRLALAQSDFAEATTLAEEMLEICRSTGDDIGAAFALNNLGWAAAAQGAYDRAETLYLQSLTLYRAAGHDTGECSALANLGGLDFVQGNFAAAVRRYDYNLSKVRALGDKSNLPIALGSLGDAVLHTGDHERALELYGEALPIFNELGDRYGIAQIEFGLGTIALTNGDFARAARHLLESFTTFQEIGDQTIAIECLERLAQLTHLAGEAADAAQLFGAVEALRERRGVPIRPLYQDDHDRYFAAVQACLGETQFNAALSRGRAMEMADAFVLVREVERRFSTDD